MRIILFLITNFAVILIFNCLLNIIGMDFNNIKNSLVVISILGFIGSFISLSMSKYLSLRAVNGRIINYPSNEKERNLINIINKQSKKININTPEIALYESLDINAFATGAKRNSSLIAVSTGLLKNMNFDEIEAVIAHEMSHINSGDMVTMTLIQGITNTFVLFLSHILSQVITLLFSSNNEENNRINNNIYFILSIVLETFLGLLSSIIILWFSRRREFHADAGSAKLVGREKMIAALNKLKTSYEPYESNSVITFCINGKKNGIFSKLFMSHPSLDDRIKALNDGRFLN